MNPREFCQEASFEYALLLTYSFDPLFFERVVLRDLRIGGTSDCVVVADRGVVDEVLPRAVGQVHSLGRRYRLVTPSRSGIQHAKLILRAGTRGAMVWLGSGNLTSGGWGSNREVATAWRVTPDDEGAVAQFLSLLSDIAPLIEDAPDPVLRKIRGLPWLTVTSPENQSPSSVLFSRNGMTLAAQLSRRWHERTFRSVRVLTGSTDRVGAFLGWAAGRFGLETAIVALDPHATAFDPGELEKLPLDVRIVPLAGSPRPHAKFYLFEGDNEMAAVAGSANCSAAAWLLPIASGGNTEAVVVYDQCSADEVSSLLAPFFAGEEHEPREVLEDRPVDDVEKVNAKTGHSIEIVDFSASRTMGQMRLQLKSGCPPIIAIQVRFGELRSPLHRLEGSGMVFVGDYPDLPKVNGTQFAILEFTLTEEELFSTLRWLDEEDQLNQSSVRDHIASIGRLDRSCEMSEQKQIVEAISDAARNIFAVNDFPDPRIGAERVHKEEEAEAGAVDPHELVKSLNDVARRPEKLRQDGARTSLPLQGIMRLLFLTDEQATDGIVELGDEDSVVLLPEESDAQTPRSTPLQCKEPAAQFKKRLVKTMNDFLERECRPEFLLACTATQLVQAIAFPLAIAERGVIGGWIDAETSQSWSRSVLDLLLNKEIVVNSHESHYGAIDMIESRYARDDRRSTLNKVLGDGLLWTALVANITQLPSRDASQPFAKALFLADLFNAPVLYRGADSNTVAAAARAHWSRCDPDEFLKLASRVAALVTELEHLLRFRFDELRELQLGMRHEEGELVYRPESGFGWTQEAVELTASARVPIYLRRRGTIRPFKANFYCNVRLAAESSQQVSAILESLHTEVTHE